MGIDFNDMAVRILMVCCAALFFALSYHVVRNDLKHQKIPNILLIQYLKYGLALFGLFFVYGLLWHNKFVLIYVRVALANAAVATAFGYAFWHLDLWSPGDGKYFPVAALLVPVKAYTSQYVGWFPALLILVNAYIIAFAMFFLYAVALSVRSAYRLYRAGTYSREFCKNVKTKARATAMSPAFYVGIGGTLFFLLSFLMLMRAGYQAFYSNVRLSTANQQLVSIVALFFVGRAFQDVVRRYRAALYAAYGAFALLMFVRIVMLRDNVLADLENMLLTSFFMMVFLPLGRWMIEESQRASEMMTVEDVRMGVSLSYDTANMFYQEKGVEIPYDVEITDEQAQRIKDNFPNMTVIRKAAHITFGPFIFLGAVFLMLFGHSIMHYF